MRTMQMYENIKICGMDNSILSHELYGQLHDLDRAAA